ncbi:hypothetical protein BA895_17585 [Humibacillus sp. DSM 29435]|uniref:PfkB family carbohydrate kinase n=1 Tax=Humibacillus sp. DSM 29435 TaxID=1869167 RepID=UPI000872679D|nr:PfkB family carbohydrate kinase [Humibacillus sp. DSM 29435]OFE17247.1 hypothetical protein BA895_17585 [Humibacillus sp. DSM 29435]
MIVTLTLNPSLDLTYLLAETAVGQVEVHRATTATIEASGKGVNVSRALHANGRRTVAVLPLGGTTGHHLAELLGTDGVPFRSTTQRSDTRINTTLAVDGGHTAKVNGPGGHLTDADLAALKREVDAALRDAATADSDQGAPGAGGDQGAPGAGGDQGAPGADSDQGAPGAGGDQGAPGAGGDQGAPGAGGDQELWLAVCGSLPPGVDPAVVGEFVTLAHARGARCAIDASGPALAAAISAGADLLAPNRLELAEVAVAATAAQTVHDLASVALDVAAATGAALLVSLGKDGALFTDGTVVIHGHGPALTPVNTAGAGDALLAGWLAGASAPADRMQRAIRWGRAACLSSTTVAGPVSDLPHPSALSDPADRFTTVEIDTIRPHPAGGNRA